MADPRRIAPGDPEYDFVFNQWVRNGRPAQFDYESSAGGAIYHVIDRQAEQPIFSVWAEAPGTLYDDSLPGGNPIQVGFGLHPNRTGRYKIRTVGRETDAKYVITTEPPIREKVEFT